MTLPYRIGLIALVVIAAFFSGYSFGQKHELAKMSEAALAAYQNAGDIQNEINNLDDYALCLRLGGMSDNCKILLRGLDKTPKGE